MIDLRIGAASVAGANEPRSAQVSWIQLKEWITAFASARQRSRGGCSTTIRHLWSIASVS
jgi:hypothetical protein